MANVQPPAYGNNPVSFGELFENMIDIYNGVYHPLLNEYEHNDQVTALELMNRTITRLPPDQIPVVFLYQDTHSTIRVVHHIHQVEALLGQPATLLTNEFLGFNGEVVNGTAQLLKLPSATFFSSTGDTVVLTPAALTAQIAAAANGLVGPLNQGDPDTEVVNTRRAVPVPHAYVRLVAFRTLTPQQAWQQLGQQIILDGREADCAVLLNFLRASTVLVRGAVRNQPPTMPVTCQLEGIWPPVDGPLLEHTHRKLRQILPGSLAPPNAPAVPMAQTIAIVNQTVAEGFEAMRADRLQEREAAAVPKSFSDVFPANAGIRRLCLAGNDDDLLPEFWQSFANVKGKKGLGLSIFNNMVQQRAGMEDSAGVTPVVSTGLFVNISSFELGALDLETITQGVSPFLMCPTGHSKANTTMILTQKYMMLQGENNLPLLGDVQQLIPSNDYTIPEDLHSLVDFVGAYSVIWDVLVGEQHPLATTIRVHHRFWVRYVRMVQAAIPEAHLKNVVIIGTLRGIQLAVLRYVNEIMVSDRGPVTVPNFRQIEEAIHGRQFQILPSLPAAYQQPAPASTFTKSASQLPLPPVVAQNPTPPNQRRQSGTTGNQVVAPPQDRTSAFIDVFAASDKTIQQLRFVGNQPKVKNGTGTLCLSYHLKGLCCDNCRKISTHRKLEKVEIDNMQRFIAANL